MPKRVESAVEVRNVKTPGRHFAGETLYLMVWPKGRKSWVQRLTIEGRRTDLGLGPYPAVSLAQARQKARENRFLAKSGGNPLAGKQEEASLAEMPTFEALARQHIAENRHSWRNTKHRAQWLSTLETYAFPILGALKVNEITRRQVVDVLSPIWTSKPETARRVRQRVRAVMDRAVALEHVDYNPAGDAIKAALAKQRRVKDHHRALPYGNLPAALQAVRESTASASVKLGFEMLALTACRSGEVRGMTWDEVNLQEATWTGPRGTDEGREAPPRASRAPQFPTPPKVGRFASTAYTPSIPRHKSPQIGGRGAVFGGGNSSTGWKQRSLGRGIEFTRSSRVLKKAVFGSGQVPDEVSDGRGDR